MSNFPQQLDSFPYILDPSVVSRPIPINKKPKLSNILSKVYDALEKIEKHVGNTCVAGGDMRSDGTTIGPMPGKKVVLLETDLIISQVQSGLYGINIPFNSLFSDKGIINSNPIIASILPNFGSDYLSNTNLPVELNTQSPFYFKAKRVSGEPVICNIFPSSSVTSYLAISLPLGITPFLTGERIHISLFFIGG